MERTLPLVIVRLPDGTTALIAAMEAPHQVDEQIRSWDCAFKDMATSDYVVGQAWARMGALYPLADQTRGRMDCPIHGQNGARVVTEKDLKGQEAVANGAGPERTPLADATMPTATSPPSYR